MLVLMKRFQNGFTIVEILVVVGTLGILVTIGLVGWGQMVKWSQNNARESELTSWADTLKLYKSRFAYYPLSETSRVLCLGDNFEGHTCGPNNTILENTNLPTEIRKVGKMPQYDHPIIDKGGTKYVGPYVRYTISGSTTTTVLTGIFDRDDCPKGTTRDAASPAGLSYCTITLP